MNRRVWNQPWRSCFEQVFDVAVIGTGYAGYAAARAIEARGQSVLLLDRGSDLLWESGRAMACETGTSEHALWHALIDDLRARHAASDDAHDGQLDGPAAEVLASNELFSSNVQTLYYAAPVDVELDGELLLSVIVATKGGLRRVVARQWIDATETGELLTRIEQHSQRHTPRRAPSRQRIHLAIQHHDWPTDLPERIEPPETLNEATLSLHATLWPTQRTLRIEVPGTYEAWERWPETNCAALQALHDAMPETMAHSAVSHMSLMPFAIYEGRGEGTSAARDKSAVSNVNLAAPTLCDRPVATLADRFALGIEAADRLGELVRAAPSPEMMTHPIQAVTPARTLSADVVVAGAGTGGAIAAIAAGRSGADVLCIEPMAFPGGIGAGGGIHNYYFGVPGGLQAELDQRVKEKMDLFGSMTQVRGFHPEAKKLTLIEMMREAGVRFSPHTMLFDVQTTGRRATRALAAHPDGPATLQAKTWIDSTGDGDLCALAGAAFNKGRAGDGLMHAYTQSAGRVLIEERQQQPFIRVAGTNYDAGWVDPTDSEDLTRGRLVGICQYLRDQYDPWNRQTYIAPAIGLRQGRQVQACYMLTLADLIERRHFPDVIGFTGSHYDNHAVDYEFESDEAVFWVWLCRQWRTSLASEMPYRMIVPRDLDNVWIGSRALGVTQDAHACCRMQRDIQRAGEAAGYAAALAASRGLNALDVPMDQVQNHLIETGAIKLERVRTDGPWGDRTIDLTMLTEPDEPTDADTIAHGLDCLARGVPDRTLWHLYRSRDRVGKQVRDHLNGDNPRVTWLAAGICAMWGESEAEPRLLEAIRTREYGYDEFTDQHMKARKATEGPRPEAHAFLAPNWFTAISLLRCCGTEASLPMLLELAREPQLLLNARTSIAITVERLIRADRLEDTSRVSELIDALLNDEATGSFIGPRRIIGQLLREKIVDMHEPEAASAPSSRPEGVTTPQHSLLWQLHLQVARLCRLIDAPLPTMLEAYRHDHRLGVRAAFGAALEDTAPTTSAGAAAATA